MTCLSLLVLSTLSPVTPCKGDSAGFEATGNLSAARYDHTATLLLGGKVLVAGGFNYSGGGPPTMAEVYDPATGISAFTGNDLDFRWSHSATLLPDGRVLVAGGKNGILSDTATAELYDPASDTWTATGSLNHRRLSHPATLLPDGQILVCGGFEFDLYLGLIPLATAELYDPTSGTWTETGDLTTLRGGHTATLLPSGKVLVAGGTNHLSLLSTSELYDPATGVWTATGSMAAAREFHTATLLHDGRVIVAGGYGSDGASAELYDPGTETWVATGNLNTGRSGHTATLLPDGTVLVAGGTNGQSPVASAELYSPESGTWTATGSLATARTAHTATLLPDGTVLVAGGTDVESLFSTAFDSAELFVHSPTLLNISSRLDVQTGNNVMIGGFIVSGTEAQTVIVRGIGPSLGVPGALSDPVIDLHDSAGQLLATNDNWRGDPNQQKVSDAGLAPTNDSESALWQVIDPGAYTVILKGNNGGTGVGLVEVYQLGQGSGATLANISTRGLVQTGDNVLIGGLIVGGGTGDGSANVMVRALGPSLPVADTLSDPSLELYDGSGTLIDSNDDWKTRPDGSSQQAEIEATTIPPNNDLESALVETLPPGNYTAVVRGKNIIVGVGMVEVYNLP